MREGGRGQRWTEETTEGGTEARRPRGLLGAKGPKGQTTGERGLREREARPGEEQAGLSLPGWRWSILQWVGARMGRPCSAVTSGAARRWPRSPQLINLPCPGLAEAAGARRAPPPTTAGSRASSVRSRALFRFVVLSWSS